MTIPLDFLEIVKAHRTEVIDALVECEVEANTTNDLRVLYADFLIEGITITGYKNYDDVQLAEAAYDFLDGSENPTAELRQLVGLPYETEGTK